MTVARARRERSLLLIERFRAVLLVEKLATVLRVYKHNTASPWIDQYLLLETDGVENAFH